VLKEKLEGLATKLEFHIKICTNAMTQKLLTQNLKLLKRYCI